jgi:hypothetical protein
VSENKGLSDERKLKLTVSKGLEEEQVFGLDYLQVPAEALEPTTASLYPNPNLPIIDKLFQEGEAEDLAPFEGVDNESKGNRYIDLDAPRDLQTRVKDLEDLFRGTFGELHTITDGEANTIEDEFAVEEVLPCDSESFEEVSNETEFETCLEKPSFCEEHTQEGNEAKEGEIVQVDGEEPCLSDVVASDASSDLDVNAEPYSSLDETRLFEDWMHDLLSRFSSFNTALTWVELVLTDSKCLENDLPIINQIDKKLMALKNLTNEMESNLVAGVDLRRSKVAEGLLHGAVGLGVNSQSEVILDEPGLGAWATSCIFLELESEQQEEIKMHSGAASKLFDGIKPSDPNVEAKPSFDVVERPSERPSDCSLLDCIHELKNVLANLDTKLDKCLEETSRDNGAVEANINEVATESDNLKNLLEQDFEPSLDKDNEPEVVRQEEPCLPDIVVSDPSLGGSKKRGRRMKRQAIMDRVKQHVRMQCCDVLTPSLFVGSGIGYKEGRRLKRRLRLQTLVARAHGHGERSGSSNIVLSLYGLMPRNIRDGSDVLRTRLSFEYLSKSPLFPM